MNIRKTLAIVLLSLVAFSVSAQLPTEVMGTLKKKYLNPVKLYKVQDGKTIELANSTPNKNGNFGFIFYPEYEGLYVIGTGNAGGPNDNYKFYFKGGDKLAVTLLDSSYVLNGKLNSKENIVLTQWHDLVFPLEMRAVNFMKIQSTFVDYFPLQEEIVAKTKNFFTGKATGNPTFDKNMPIYMKWDLACFATNFINTPRSAHPAPEEFSPFYSTLNIKNFSGSTTEVYAYPYGTRTLGGLKSLNTRVLGIKPLPGLEGLKNNINYIANDTLKGDEVLETAARCKTYSEYKDIMDAYGKYVITANQKKKSVDIATPLVSLAAGGDAYAFSYPDKDGKIVTMESLKGKVVLVDVWATWCGPCKVEIPHLKKLEEEMKGKNIAIISLSTDAVSDKAKWLKMIKDENLGGIQLFAGGPGNEFSQYYKVNTIPRFLVFNKQGKIVSSDSPRPSNPALKSLLEKELAK